MTPNFSEWRDDLLIREAGLITTKHEPPAVWGRDVPDRVRIASLEHICRTQNALRAIAQDEAEMARARFRRALWWLAVVAVIEAVALAFRFVV